MLIAMSMKCYEVSPKNLFHWYSQDATTSGCNFDQCLYNNIELTPISSNKNREICEKCEMQIRKRNMVRHEESCTTRALFCSEFSKFLTFSRADLSFHSAKKRSSTG